MSTITSTTNPLDKNRDSSEIGITITRGELVSAAMILAGTPFNNWNNTANTQKSEYCIYLHVANGGNLLVEGADGNIIPFIGLLNGDWILVKGRRVLPSATLSDGNPYTTTCTGITWYGGQ